MLTPSSGFPRCGSSGALFLSRRFNAFFEHADAQLFLARRGGRVVGRVSAQIDHAFNEFQGNDWGMFGFLEVEEDQEVLRALLDAAAAWLRERGRDRMVGPMDFTMNDECGVLIEGFERPPMVEQPWQPPYYQRAVRGGRAPEGHGPADVGAATSTTARTVRARHGGAGREARARARRTHPEDVAAGACGASSTLFGEIYNEAWTDNWGFVPYSKRGPRPLRPGAPAGLRPQLVHDRREGGTARAWAWRSRSPT